MDPTPPPSGQAAISVVRRPALQDAVRSYTVFIDDSPVGKIGAFRQARFPVAPGHHTLQLRIVGTGTSESAAFSLEVAPGETKVFRTRKLGWKTFSLAPLGILFPDRFAPRPWIQLEPDP